MDFPNQTILVDFMLSSLSTHHFTQLFLFIIFLLVYLFSFVCNLSMICLIWEVPRLHAPMYFFLSHLSLIDLCYSSTIIPKMLSDFLSEKKCISFYSCATQMFFFATFATAECFMVTSMAYDRYMAICQPLVYHISMNTRFCWWLVTGVYISSLVASLVHTITVFHFPLCGSNIINHFYCDIPPLLKLACRYTQIRKFVVFFLSVVMGIVSLVVILSSYIYIISTIIRMKSQGRSKAFSTCTSHLAVVVLFYTTVFCVYFRPSLGLDLGDIDKLFSIFYTVVSPLLNPLIYSFKNMEVKRALNHFLGLKEKLNF
ncbi:hypothetical protein GDO86_006710 [Hymenochirus boettgeri]|uniref:Olfactory receptor n=1 Tax=Hymenochirus boettgeri TaxID=247094 RepID=A0A8T2J7A2_9PIPI|nr:hypothetical protein GDO86_006710 [Hymenochirus boettgeri]